MANELSPTSPVDSFFLRCGLKVHDKAECFKVAEELNHGKSVIPASCQGYCSLTLFLGEALVIQFRPPAYRLNLQITAAARHVWHSLVPETAEIHTNSVTASGLLIYRMERINGSSLADVQMSTTPAVESFNFLSKLCTAFAAFLSQSWHRGRLDYLPLGLVGQSLISRLKSLVSDLPCRFHERVRHIIRNFHHVEGWPWVLTHGDIRASNLMVDVSTGALLGVIDWAEAERLPFGICLYGLEELLGNMTPLGFQYRADADVLRQVFWNELTGRIPELNHKLNMETIGLVRDLGVLLWFGFAWDDGALDRVVEDGRDVEEIHKLDAFLAAETFPLTDVAAEYQAKTELMSLTV